MRSESVIGPTPRGAGRIRDINWPDYDSAGGASGNTNLRTRVSGTGPQAGQFNNLGTLLTVNQTFFQGLDIATVNDGGVVGTGGSISWRNVCNIHVRTTQPAVYWPQDDDWNVYRVVWIGMVNPLPGTNGQDSGLQFINSNTSSDGIQRTPQLGFGIQFTTTGTSFIANNGGGAVLTTIGTDGVGGWLSINYHSYDFRLISAFPGQPARLKLYVDNVLKINRSWEDGTLPVPAGATCGFWPALWNNTGGGVNAGVCTRLLSFQAAPTELMCL